MQTVRFLAGEMSERDIQILSKHVLRLMMHGPPRNTSCARHWEMQSLLWDRWLIALTGSQHHLLQSSAYSALQYLATNPFSLMDFEFR
jgi:hypothetical protein